jgi:electron-transferring-flavoprotein dehydrogenase
MPSPSGSCWHLTCAAADRFGPVDQPTFRHVDVQYRQHGEPHFATLRPAQAAKPFAYSKPDGVVNFNRPSSVFLSGTNHEEDQPAELVLADATVPLGINLTACAEPAQRYCPAGVYEIVTGAGTPRFQFNSHNCIHCKTCDIRDPAQNINCFTPEGGGGPRHTNT